MHAASWRPTAVGARSPWLSDPAPYPVPSPRPEPPPPPWPTFRRSVPCCPERRGRCCPATCSGNPRAASWPGTSIPRRCICKSAVSWCRSRRLHAAVTLIGHEAAAYPVGTAPTGDFNFPHQVENAADAQRVVLAIDVLCEPDVRRLLPPALADAASLRRELAREACRRLLQWRAGESVGDPRWMARRLADSAASPIRRR